MTDQVPPTDNPWAPPPSQWTQPVAPVWDTTAVPPPPPSGGSSKKVVWLSVLACVVVAGVVAASVILFTKKKSPSSSVAGPSPTLPANRSPFGNGGPGGTTPPTLAPANGVSKADESALESMVLKQSDIGNADQVGPIDNGNQVQGEPTLDLCNGTYPSEGLRVARLQVATAQTSFSTEAVLYNNTGGTAQAFSELRSVAAKCPAAPVPSPVGEPTLTTHFNAPPDGSWPQTSGVERLAFDITVTDGQGSTNRSIAVYLRRGRALEGVYFPTASGPQLAVDGKTTIPEIVTVFAQRLAKLPSSIVDGHETPPAPNGSV